MPDTGILDFEMSELLLSKIFFGNCFRLLNAMHRRVCTTGFHVILFFPRKKPHVSHEVFRGPRIKTVVYLNEGNEGNEPFGKSVESR